MTMKLILLQINKDVRRMDLVPKPDGSPPDLEAKADLCIFEVRLSIHRLQAHAIKHCVVWAVQPRRGCKKSCLAMPTIEHACCSEHCLWHMPQAVLT